LYRPVVDKDRDRIGNAFRVQAQDGAKVVGFETSGFDPALSLLVNDGLGRQIVRHHAPNTASTHLVAQRVAEFAQAVNPLWGHFRRQRQIANANSRLFIIDIARITLSLIAHLLLIAETYIFCTNCFCENLSTGSKRSDFWQSFQTAPGPK
jgi:hypothetical protein